MTMMKQAQLNQILFVMVDKTDFASIESGVTSDFTCKLVTVKHGGSVAASTVTLSRVPSVVSSGLFRLTLKAADTSGVDYGMLRITHASCADQFIPLDFTGQDVSNYLSNASNYLSNISALISDVDSQLLLNASMISDAHSAAILAASHASDAHSAAITCQSYLSGMSNILSAVYVDTADISDVLSKVYVHTSNINSGFVTSTYLSDALSKMQSDINSHVSGITASISASDISDIASRVWSEKWNIHSVASSFGSQFEVMKDATAKIGGMSDILSRVYVDTTDISNILSNTHADLANLSGIVSDFLSDFQSRITKEGANASQLLLVKSMASDAHSAATQANSRTLVLESSLSDVESQLDLVATSAYLSDALSKLHSDIKSEFDLVATSAYLSDVVSALSDQLSDHDSDMRNYLSDTISKVGKLASRITAPVATSDQLSKAQSDICSHVSGVTATISTSDLSNIASRVWSEKWDVHSNASSFGSAFEVLMSDLSDLTSRITGAVATASDVASKVWAEKWNANSGASSFGSLMELISSRVSDLDSGLVSVHSDLRSQISGITATISASDISDIASAVWGEKYTDHSAASTFGSLVSLLATSAYLSDVYSALSNQISGITATISASDISDIASKVWAEHYATHSLASSFGSLVSTIGSKVTKIEGSQFDAISAMQSEILSDVGSKVLNVSAAVSASNISDIASKVWAEKWTTHSGASSFGSAIEVMMSGISDLTSRITKEAANASQLLLVKSLASDAHSAAILAASNASEAQSVALQNKSMISDIESALDSQFAIIKSNLSDVESQVDLLATTSYVSDVHSALSNQISGMTATISASDISDIASAVWANALGSDVISKVTKIITDISDVDSELILIKSSLSDVESAIDALNDPTASNIASKVWGYTINETTAGPSPTTAKDKVQAIWNRLFTKKTVTSGLEASYEKDNTTAMETWTLADDDTTASRTP